MSVSSFGDLLGERVDLVLTDGTVWGRGRAIGYFSAPSYVVDIDEGGHGHDRTGWSASLTREATAGDNLVATDVTTDVTTGPAPTPPATLTSVDDVRRVCEAAGLPEIGSSSARTRRWSIEPVSVTVDDSEWTVITLRPTNESAPVIAAIVAQGAPAAVLFAAIQAARSTS